MVYPGTAEYEDWMDRHPLKIWMKENKLTRMDVASFTGRTPTMIYQWLRGVSLPSKSWVEIQKMMGDADIQDKWMDWLKS